MKLIMARSGALLVTFFFLCSGAIARDLDLEIFPSAAQEDSASRPGTRPRDSALRPPAQARPEASRTHQVQPEKAAPDAALQSQQERQKKARDAAALFAIETADLAALKRMDPPVECYNDLCVTKRTNFLSYRGMNVCTSDVSLTAAAGRITTVGCEVAITTARDINAALLDLLGNPKKSQTDMSATLSWMADKRSIQIVYWKGTNVHGVPYEKWTVHLGER